MTNNDYVNKVVFNGDTLIDLTNDTITAEDLKDGVTAHDKSGNAIVGTLEVNEGGGDTTAEDGLIERTLTACSNNRVTTVGNYAFYQYSSLTTANFPLVTTIGNYAFQNCRGLTTANFPLVTTIGDSVFRDCRGLTTATLPVATSIGIYAFMYNYSLTTLILRNTTQVCTLTSINAFTNCYHYHGTVHATYNPSGLKDGYIYVPASLIDNYKVATNWSTFATQFRALEDYTVDGTTTGELDESKI